jgi:pyruvate,water dikinase
MSAHVLPLAQCQPDDLDRVGGKALGLGSLLREGLQVPPGFAITTHAYRESVVWPGLQSEVVRILARYDGPDAQAAASDRIRALFERAVMMDTVSTEIALAYERLGDGRPVPVAVRSSATAEDLADASFAGQQETYLWVRGAAEVVRAVKRCWGSLFTPQAISYRHHFGVPTADLAMAVVVQRMVDATAAGVMITLDPVTGDRSQITIESSFGLGLAVVGGEVTPDRYAVDKVTYDIRSRTLGPKPFAYRHDVASREVVRVEVPSEDQLQPSITDDEVLALARLGRAVERAHGSPQDVEWAVGPGLGGDREIYLLQTRPETVWSRRPAVAISDPDEPILERMLQAISRPLRLRDPVGPAAPGGDGLGSTVGPVGEAMPARANALVGDGDVDPASGAAERAAEAAARIRL